jgi:hypothetical protein
MSSRRRRRAKVKGGLGCGGPSPAATRPLSVAQGAENTAAEKPPAKEAEHKGHDAPPVFGPLPELPPESEDTVADRGSLARPPEEKTAPALVPDLPVNPPVAFTVLQPDALKARTIPPRTLRLAVTPAHYDDMGRLLTNLGEGYRHTLLHPAALYNPKALAQFDVVFLTCAASTSLDARLNRTVRQFVEQGGTLYASDLRFDVLVGAFPEYIDRSQLGRTGAGFQTVKARVIDPGLRAELGEEIPLQFNVGGWRPAAFQRTKVTTCLEGKFRADGGWAGQGPLLVKFAHKKGVVIFTSFHNAAQNSELEKKLLEYLVFTAVTVQVEAEVRKAMTGAGFAPQDTRRLHVSAGQTTEAHPWTSTRAGPLQFALGFEPRGVKVRLTLRAPGGQQFEHEATSPFLVETSGAAAGEWRYSVTASAVPFRNYPLTMTVGTRAP